MTSKISSKKFFQILQNNQKKSIKNAPTNFAALAITFWLTFLPANFNWPTWQFSSDCGHSWGQEDASKCDEFVVAQLGQ
jgi:hypothetical protein